MRMLPLSKPLDVQDWLEIGRDAAAPCRKGSLRLKGSTWLSRKAEMVLRLQRGDVLEDPRWR